MEKKWRRSYYWPEQPASGCRARRWARSARARCAAWPACCCARSRPSCARRTRRCPSRAAPRSRSAAPGTASTGTDPTPHVTLVSTRIDNCDSMIIFCYYSSLRWMQKRRRLLCNNKWVDYVYISYVWRVHTYDRTFHFNRALSSQHTLMPVEYVFWE